MAELAKMLCCIKDAALPNNNRIDIINGNLQPNINEPESDKLCGICIFPLEHKTTITELKNSCQHEFCQNCVVNMVKYCKSKKITLRCPLCRNE